MLFLADSKQLNVMHDILLLKAKLSELQAFKTNLDQESLIRFKELKKEIIELLDENQKIRFHQISFYSEKQEYSYNADDDLPF